MVAESPVSMELHLEGTGLLMQVFVVLFHYWTEVSTKLTLVNSLQLKIRSSETDEFSFKTNHTYDKVDIYIFLLFL